MYWQELTTKAFAETAVGRVDTVLIPVGSVEAHGLHLPLGSDNYAPEALCRQLERRYPERVAVAPTIAYGHAWELANWPGTLSLSSRVVADYAAEVGRATVNWGMRHVIFMNGHGGNVGPLTEALERVAELGAKALLINWRQDFSAEILTVASAQGHAGEDETSVLLAIHKDLVFMQDAQENPHRQRALRIKSEDMLEKRFRHALTGNAKPSSAEKGEQILSLIDQRLADLIEDVWADRLFEERRD